MIFDAVGVFGLTFDFLLKICLSILWFSSSYSAIYLESFHISTQGCQNLKKEMHTKVFLPDGI
jgi:hypothetical protein